MGAIQPVSFQKVGRGGIVFIVRKRTQTVNNRTEQISQRAQFPENQDGMFFAYQ